MPKQTLGICRNCNFRGVLERKAMATGADMNAVTGETAEALPYIPVCVTCFKTPTGCVSDNLNHKRLPAEEYQRP